MFKKERMNNYKMLVDSYKEIDKKLNICYNLYVLGVPLASTGITEI